MTDEGRSMKTRKLITDIKDAGHTYKRFYDREDLKPEIMHALIRTLDEEYGIRASSVELHDSEHLIEASSTFESTAMPDIPMSALDRELIEAYASRIAADTNETWTAVDALRSRGLAFRGDKAGTVFANVAAFVLLGPTRPTVFRNARSSLTPMMKCA